MKGSTLDKDALIAAVDLVGRSGATNFEVGYLHDDVPSERAGWYAQAQYRGARLIAEDHRGPIEAAEALARRVLAGAECAHCHRPVVLGGGVELSACRWTRRGARWARGCEIV